MSRGIRKECPHCGYKDWWSNHYMRESPHKTNCDQCPRCFKDMNKQPDDDGYETVSINGRLVGRKK